MVNINKSIDIKDIAISIPDNAKVTVTEMGHLTELQYMERQNKVATILKLNKNEYVLLRGDEAGTVKEFKHKDNRGQSLNSIRKTLKRLRYLINNNFNGAENELFVTLTYAENMTDTNRLYRDFKKFIQKLKRYYSETPFEYLNVIEPQARGAWHCHLLLKFISVDKMYINNDFLRKMWGQGFVHIRRLNNVDNIGAYLSAYLADLEITEETTLDDLKLNVGHSEVIEKVIQDYDGSITKKRFIKGGRLFMYPNGVQIYRKSKGIKMPERYEQIYSDAKKGVAFSPDYTKSVELLVDDKHFSSIAYEYYNKKRALSQVKPRN